ncbi:MAG TPA: hypothetical protein VFU13_05130 [Steroidobacteraceae bacterium]|nr:hypothetical protein [Steroidobacteraceae bacterium]
MNGNSIVSGLLAAALLGAGVANAGVNEFTRTGNEGGYITAIAAQPGNGNLVLAGSGRGIYRSTNGGAAWTLQAPSMLGLATHIAFDPDTPARVFVLNRQVYVSEDAGQTFTATTPITIYLDYLAVSGNRVYAGMLNGTIYRSDDNAQTWAPLSVPWPAPSARMHAIGADPADDDVLYACVEGRGTYKTTDHGVTWTNPPPGISPCSSIFNTSHSIVVSPADPNRILSTTSDGIFLSTNGGASWTAVTNTPFLDWLAFDPLAPDNVFSVDISGRVTRSVNGGDTWPFFPADPYLKLDRVEGASFAGAAGHLYIASPNGPMYSSDNGATFTLRANGIQAIGTREIVAADDGTIYATQQGGQTGVYRRSAGAWLPLDNPELMSRILNAPSFMDIATSPEDPSLLYVAFMIDGIHRSNDGGASWVGPPPSANMQIWDIAVDPTNPLIAYAAKPSGGLLRTANGGVSFATCGPSTMNGLRNVVVDRASPNILYGTARSGQSQSDHLFKSTDSCATWTDISFPDLYYFNHIAIDPVDHQKIYLAHYAGVQRSRDGGATWEPIHFNFAHGDVVIGFRVLIDPVLPGTIWVLNNDVSGFARSVDDGATWQKVDYAYVGNAIYLQAGVLDPLRPDTLVAAANPYGMVEYQVAPDLQVTLDAPAVPVPTGTSAVATVNLRNNGPLDASAADITISLPALLSVSALPAGCTSNAGAVRCRVAPVRVNQSMAIPLTLVAAATPGSGSISISVAGHEADPVTANNSASAAVQTVRRADLVVSGPAGPTIARTTSINLDFTLASQGPDIAENARVTFTLPAGLQATAATSPTGACTVTASLVTCTLGTLNAGASTTAQLRVQGMTAGTHEVATQLASDAVDTDQDHSARTSVVVQANADLSVELAVTAGTLTTGTPFQYIATIRNLGPDAAAPRADLTVTGATITTATTTSASGLCAVSGGSVQCQLGDLANAASTTVTLTVNPATAGSPSAEATVTFTGADPGAPNNRATLTATVTAPPPPPASSSSGGGRGGGGGSLDWLVLGLLAGALARSGFRARRLPQTRRTISLRT